MNRILDSGTPIESSRSVAEFWRVYRWILAWAGRRRFELAIAAAGAIVLLLLPYASWDELKSLSMWARILIGGALGFGLIWGLRALRLIGSSFGIETIELKLPIIEQTAVFRLTPAQRTNAWTLFVALATRISTQSLFDSKGHGVGRIDEAIASLYQVFLDCREELGKVGATPLLERKVSGGATFEAFVLQIMNTGLRPFLSRWHPLHKRWIDSGMVEETWPLADQCRADLEQTRRTVLIYMGGLARIAGIDDPSLLLADLQPKTMPPVVAPVDPGQVYATAAALFPSLPKELEAGYRGLYIALAAKLPSEPPDADAQLIAKAVAQLDEFKKELEQKLPPLPRLPSVAPTCSGESAVALDRQLIALLRADLAPFLLSWSEVAQSWTAAPPAVPAEPPATPAAGENPSPESIATCSAALRDCIRKSSAVLDTLGARLQLL